MTFIKLTRKFPAAAVAMFAIVAGLITWATSAIGARPNEASTPTPTSNRQPSAAATVVPRGNASNLGNKPAAKRPGEDFQALARQLQQMEAQIRDLRAQTEQQAAVYENHVAIDDPDSSNPFHQDPNEEDNELD